MGKKSRLKKERRMSQESGEKKDLIPRKIPFLLKFIFCFVFLTLFAPLVVNSDFYFPFVGLKSLVFMAGVEIIFLAWLILILRYKRYRPKLNSVLIAFTFFLIILILSSVLEIGRASCRERV